MVDEKILEKTYMESLEENIITYISEKKKLSFEMAMDLYYSSELSRKIQEGVYGIQYLDYKNLGDIFLEFETV